MIFMTPRTRYSHSSLVEQLLATPVIDNVTMNDERVQMVCILVRLQHSLIKEEAINLNFCTTYMHYLL